MRFLRKYIFANAGLKLLALGISFLLWATYTAEPYAEVGFQVPLEFTTMPPQLEISGDVPTAVHVRVRGRSALLRRMIPADLNSAARHARWQDREPRPSISRRKWWAPRLAPRSCKFRPPEIHVTLVPRHGPAPPVELIRPHARLDMSAGELERAPAP